MEFLRDVYEKRRKYFERIDEYLKEIKEIGPVSSYLEFHLHHITLTN